MASCVQNFQEGKTFCFLETGIIWAEDISRLPKTATFCSTADYRTYWPIESGLSSLTTETISSFSSITASQCVQLVDLKKWMKEIWRSLGLELRERFLVRYWRLGDINKWHGWNHFNKLASIVIVLAKLTNTLVEEQIQYRIKFYMRLDITYCKPNPSR